VRGVCSGRRFEGICCARIMTSRRRRRGAAGPAAAPAAARRARPPRDVPRATAFNKLHRKLTRSLRTFAARSPTMSLVGSQVEREAWVRL
jgi:hypothetical protein